MSILHVNQIKTHILKIFRDLIDQSDLTTATKEERENHLLTRALAAYSLQYIAQIDSESVANSVTDGANDNGIDAVYFDERDKTLYLVQSKWIHNGSGQPDNGEVKKFISGIKDLLNNRFERFNIKINQKKDTIIKALNDPLSKCVIILAYTGNNPLSEKSKQDFTDLLDEMNDTSEVLTLKILNQQALHTSLTIGLSGEPIIVDIGIRSWGRVDNPHIAYYGQVDGTQILGLWNSYRTKLFTKNLRSVLGDTEVNTEIRETLDRQPDHFWYYNNGVTIVAKKITKTMAGGVSSDYGTFHCEDIHVVNGAQTVSTIGKHGEKVADSLTTVYVPVRIISLEKGEDNFGEIITKTNNRQNKIENRDFVTLDPEQTRIQNELKIDGIEYNLMRTESFIPNEISFDLIESTTALACASKKIPIVVQLKREIGKLWDDISKTPYIELFNPSISGMYVWRCVKAQRKIDKSLERLSKDATFSGRDQGIAIHGNRFIAALVYNQLQSEKFFDLSFDYDNATIDELIEAETKKYFQLLKDFIELDYENAVIPTLFKNRTKCIDLFNSCLHVNLETHKSNVLEKRRREKEEMEALLAKIEAAADADPENE